MDSIAKELSSPAWWLSVVVAGFLVNVLAAYAKRPLDASLDRVSARWAKRSAASRAEHDSKISVLRERPSLLARYALRELRLLAQANIFLLGSIVFHSLDSDLSASPYVRLGASIFSVALVAMGVAAILAAWDAFELVNEALTHNIQLDAIGGGKDNSKRDPGSVGTGTNRADIL